MSANILITGANGFLGSEICAGFNAAGHNVTAMVRKGANVDRLSRVCANVRYAEIDEKWENVEAIIAAQKPDIIVHTAAAMDGGDDLKSSENLLTVNVLQPARLISVAKAAGIKGFLTVGTAWQHYDNADYEPVNLYAASKQAFDDVLRYYGAVGLPCVSIHMFDTYGTDDPRPKLVNLLCKLANTGETLAMSPGEQEIDLIHAYDAARAFVMAAEQMLSCGLAGFHTFAASGGQPLPLRQLAAMMTEITGKPINIEWGGRPYRPREVMHTWRNGTPVPGWQPQMELRAALTQIWQKAS